MRFLRFRVGLFRLRAPVPVAGAIRMGDYYLVTGVLFLAAFAGIASGSQGGVTLVFSLAVVLCFTWIAMLAARLRVGA